MEKQKSLEVLLVHFFLTVKKFCSWEGSSHRPLALESTFQVRATKASLRS